MSCVKYLCIDDQPESFIKPMLEQLGTHVPGISFTEMHPQEFSSQFEEIQRLAREERYFGLLVDLRLDQDADAEGRKVYYRGPTLAQELRTRMAEKELPSFPIVLWSMNDKIVKSYSPDSSSHDLFDAVYAKDDPDHPLNSQVASEIFCLATGYRDLSEICQSNSNYLDKVIQLVDGDRNALDPRLISFLKSNVIFELAGKILNTLLRSEGLLTSAEVLAARLGIDIEKSNGSWDELLEHFSNCKYTGVFNQAWPRWWVHRVEARWSELVAHKGSLRRFSAPERVAVFNEKFGLSLAPANPIEKDYSLKYSTICVATGKPLDPIDGFKIYAPRNDIWHETKYVSAYAVINRVKKGEWMLDPLEVERFKQLTERLRNGKKN